MHSLAEPFWHLMPQPFGLGAQCIPIHMTKGLHVCPLDLSDAVGQLNSGFGWVTCSHPLQETMAMGTELSAVKHAHRRVYLTK